MQFRYLVFGLVLAAIILGFRWVNSLPGIPPVRLTDDRSLIEDLAPAPRETSPSDNAADEQRLRLEEDADAPIAQAPASPELNSSDEWVRGELQDVALPWLAETELVRTAATVLENASRGEVPRKFLGFLAPEGKFEVHRMGTLVQIDRQSYERYDPFVRTLELLTPNRAAEMFRLAEPLLGEAVRELGETEISPRELAFTALGVALDTPRVDVAAALEQPKVMYTYADEELERLVPLQKQLLRMGPTNLKTIRLWLEDFGLALAGESAPTPRGQATDWLDEDSNAP